MANSSPPIRPFDFASDNAAGVDARIFAALAECNPGTAPPYGVDELSSQINALYSDIFERETYVFATPTGTAANGLALGAVTPQYGAIFCHERAHIVTTECGAPEFFSGGARLILLPGRSHKISPETLSAALKPYQAGSLHQLRASTLSLTQATDGGTCYDCDELSALAQIAHGAQMKVHMDGARFANALVSLGVSPAAMTWKSGVDILSFGMTKNGAMNVEAVITFDREIAATLRYLHKRAGFLYSKMRFAAAQLRAYVSKDLWRENARTANANARRLTTALLACPDVTLEDPAQANQLFVHLPPAVVDALARADFKLRPWPHPAGDLHRLVGSFCDAEPLMARFEAALATCR
jgi:threonine aldolase